MGGEPGRQRFLITAATALAVAAVAFVVYFPSLENDFVNWDDPVAVLENRHIRSLDASSLRWMFLEPHNGNRIPLTWISHALFYQVAALDPFAHHLANLLFHCANGALLFLLFLAILKRANAFGRGRRAVAAAGALFWAVHPAHVESVAWVTERKDVGGTLFFLLALLAWFGYAKGKRRGLFYGLCLLAFVASLLFKPMAVTLPIVLLVLDWWPLGRLRRIFPVDAGVRKIVIEKAPFLLLSLVAGLLAINAQAPAIQTFERMPADFRVMNAFHSIVFYAEKLVAPVGLAPLHPIVDPDEKTFSLFYILCALLAGAVTLLVCRQALGGRRWPATAWCAYLVTLGPILGILQVGVQAAADRYTYIPSIALSLLPAAAVAALVDRLARQGRTLPAAALGTAGATALILLALICTRQAAVWKSSVTLWEHQTAVYPDVEHTAYSNLAKAYQSDGQLDRAIATFRKALSIPTPTPAYTLDGLGCALLALDGKAPQARLLDEAIDLFRRAAESDGSYAAPHRNLWFAYHRKGMKKEALRSIRRAVALDPEFAAAWSNLGLSLSDAGQDDEAEAAFRKAVALDGTNHEYISNLAGLRLKRGADDEAIDLYEKAARIAPYEPRSHLNLGNALEKVGRKEEAAAAYERVLRLDPHSVPAHAALARLYRDLGQPDRARRHREAARK